MLEGSILQKLRDAHLSRQSGKRPLNFGVYYKNTLVALCHALEDSILTAGTAPLVLTAFQRGKWYLQEADRYSELAEKSRQVVIMAAPESGFAEHPTGQRSNVSLVGLKDTDPVAQEWHLIILAPSYTAMVLCQELSVADYGVAGPPTEDLERKFYGFWTFEPALVREAAELAIDHIGVYNPQLQAQLQSQLQAVTEVTAPPDHLGAIVCRVVDYLHTSEDHLHHVTPEGLPANHHQILDNNLVSNELQAFLRLAQLIDQADIQNPNAAAEVAALVEMMGQLLDLPAWQVNRLRLASLLHRIGFLGGESSLSPVTAPATDEAPSCPLTCALLPGTQILRTMPRLRAIATILTHQTEYWNGTGHPAGLAGDEIPLESRILGLVADFQRRLNDLRSRESHHAPVQDPMGEALSECRKCQGDRWDPKLVEVLTLLVSGLQQGLNLPVTMPRIAAGIWLLDSHSENPYEKLELIPDTNVVAVEKF